MSITIAPEPPRQAGVQRLLAMSDAYMAALYPAESNHLLDVAALEKPGVMFFVARSDEAIVGCCALVAAGDATAEIKRMFVDPAARGLSVGRLLLQAVERQALAQGFVAVRLETGRAQPEALGLYRKCGYVEIQAFGDYQPDPLSLFMEKPIW